MIKRFLLFLGPERARFLFLLLTGTGLASLLLNVIAEGNAWVPTVQTILALSFLLITSFVIGARLDPFQRGRWAAILAPALGAIILGVTVLPNLLLPLLGGALGWVAAGAFLFQGAGRMEYQKAVKALRKDRYEEAAEIMDRLINVEPKVAQHYRFRAEIYRLWGKLDRAKRDYRKMADIAGDNVLKAVAYNGLAEVGLQEQKYADAREAALRAYELAPDEWVTPYNLGMIEDRLKNAPAALEYLNKALALNVPDARHRLLINLYIARAHSRLNQTDEAEQAVKELRKLRGGLNEWQIILQSDSATVLRAVLAADIEAAQALVAGTMNVQALANASV